MQDLRYLNDKDKFLNYAYDVLKDYFTSRENFNDFFINLSDNNTKNNFLKIISFYKFLVRDSSLISLIKDETESDRSTQQVISYLDETYKFIGIFALIEGLVEVKNYENFYNWLLEEHDFKTNPVSSKTKLRNLFSDYLKIYGSTSKAIKFFKNLNSDI